MFGRHARRLSGSEAHKLVSHHRRFYVPSVDFCIEYKNHVSSMGHIVNSDDPGANVIHQQVASVRCIPSKHASIRSRREDLQGR
jgi:hypothetical protein